MRAILAAVLLLTCLVSTSTSIGAEELQDPIDQAFDRCLAGPDAQTTVGQVRCIDTAYQTWEDEMEAAMAALVKRLDEESRVLLEESQRQWNAYRDADFAFLKGPWSQNRGTMMQVIGAASAVDRVRGRVMVLRGYLALLGDT